MKKEIPDAQKASGIFAKERKTMLNYSIAIIPGDGVGPELAQQAIKLFRTLEKFTNLCSTAPNVHFDIHILKACGDSIDACGDPMPEAILAEALSCQAVLFGNIGAKKYQQLPREKKPEQALMKIRKALQVCINLRPVRLLPELKAFSPLKESVIKDGFDILVVRDVSSGMLAGKHIAGGGESGREACDLEYYNERIIEKAASYAFRRAKQRKNKVTSLDKANVLASGALWRQKVIELSANYPEVALENRYVDAASMDVIREPGVFDVILTSNAYGDIIADELTQLSGTPCLFGSAELAPDGRGIYTPNQLHNPNEELIGKGAVCPMCIFSAVSMLLRYSLNETALAQRVDQACELLLQHRYATEELHLPDDNVLSTDAFGDQLCAILLEMATENAV